MGDWGLPDICVGHVDKATNGPALADALKTQMNDVLDKCVSDGTSRATIAHRMSEYLGGKISENYLSQYVAPSAGDKHMNVARFMAFIQATGATHLLGFLASQCELRLVTGKHAKLIERELLKERLKALECDIAKSDDDYRGQP